MTKRRIVFISMAVLTLLSLAVPASASEARIPSVQILGVVGTGEGPEGEVEHIVAIDARDPDGIITEVQVEFVGGSIVFAHTYCFLFGKGETAHMRIGNAFPGPGTYEVHARAFSVRECGARGSQRSRVAIGEVTIPAA